MFTSKKLRKEFVFKVEYLKKRSVVWKFKDIADEMFNIQAQLKATTNKSNFFL